MRSLSALAAGLAALTPFVAANTRINGDMFKNDPHGVAMQAAPMWHFGRPAGHKPCYPDDAIQGDGSQTNGNSPNQGLNYGAGCNDVGAYHGRNTPGNPMPTYYTVKYCGGDNSWRVTYSLYFKHDVGHKSDWEWVSVVWWQDGGTNNWYRGALLQSYHSGQKAEGWNDIQNTVNGWGDLLDDGKKGLDHPKVYVGAFHHAMFTTRKTTIDTPASSPGDEFRSNDWYFFPWDTTMQPGQKIPIGWDWGAAASAPMKLYADPGFDICKRWN